MNWYLSYNNIQVNCLLGNTNAGASFGSADEQFRKKVYYMERDGAVKIPEKFDKMNYAEISAECARLSKKKVDSKSIVKKIKSHAKPNLQQDKLNVVALAVATKNEVPKAL